MGVELLPTPRGPDWYTQAQYDALAALVVDVAQRHDRPPVGEHVVAHEDLEPLTRWNRTGGWDPGALRPQPRFSWIRHLEAMLPVLVY